MNDGTSNEASLPTATTNMEEAALPDPDEDFPDLNEPDDDPTEFVKPGKDGLEKGAERVPQYILGTLVVRVVAARDLEPVQKGGIGQLVFGGNRPGRSTLRNGGGAANPYASVKFGNSTQRSSEVFDTLDPIWPRQETMFMDVSLPMSELTHPDTSEPSGDSASASRGSSHNVVTYTKPPSILTVAVFHTPEIGRVNKYPTKGGILSGDSNDMFLGMASVDLTSLFTGKEHTIDEWLRLLGTETSRGSVRIVCEYEASDPPPRPGDYCRFTRYCHPRDLYPLECGRQYRVAEVDGDIVLISYTTQEGWVCSFQAHRYMLVCEERHHSPVETAQDELASIAERLSYSPLVHSIAETAERLAVDGLLGVGEEVIHGGLSLLNRWLAGGVDTIIGDVANATNWDGRYNPDTGVRLELPDMATSDAEDDAVEPNAPIDLDDDELMQALPNMPCCPITGLPMVDPVVAADGHTYERTAITRWLKTSNKSPMTGSVLVHKELVPNYGLMSSVQEAASRAALDLKQDSQQKDEVKAAPVEACGSHETLSPIEVPTENLGSTKESPEVGD